MSNWCCLILQAAWDRRGAKLPDVDLTPITGDSGKFFTRQPTASYNRRSGARAGLSGLFSKRSNDTGPAAQRGGFGRAAATVFSGQPVQSRAGSAALMRIGFP
jgi:hypothetical protein